MSIKQAVNDGLKTGLQWTTLVGMVKLFIESYLFYYFKKKKSLGHGILFSLATNLLSSIVIYLFFTPFVQLFRIIVTFIHTFSPHCTDSFVFFPYALFTIWATNIACSFLLNKLLKIHLSVKQLLTIFTSASVISMAVSALYFFGCSPKK